MSQDKIADEIVSKVDQLKSTRSVWNQIFQDCADFVLPRRSTKFFTTMSEGMPLTDKIFDGTAPWANEQLASGLHSYLTSPTQRWFKLRMKNDALNDDDEVKRWLDDSTDRMYNLFNNDETQFNPMVHELYLDLGALGTGIFYIEEMYEPGAPPLRFCTYHLGESFIQENRKGKVDQYYRLFKMAARNAVNQFPNKLPPEVLKAAEEKPWTEYEFVHVIQPNGDYNARLPKMGRNKPFVSVYVYREQPTTVAVGGYDRFPILAPRWSKVSGETYGRSPAMTCLPDIRMINTMAKTVLIAGQKIVDPPLMLPDEGFLLPIKTSPGGLNFYDSSLNPEQMIRPLETKGRVDLGEKLLESRRNQIVRSFYIDLMQLQDGPQMTATEVVQRNEDKMRLMAPMIGRLQSEFLNQLIEYVFDTMMERGLFLKPPAAIKGQELDVEYVSPVARAQRMSQLFGFQRMMENVAMIAQVKPAVLDRINEDQVPVVYSDLLDVPNKLIRSDKEVEQIRKEREATQKAAQASALAEQTSKTVANVAKAAPDVAAASVGGAPPAKKAA